MDGLKITLSTFMDGLKKRGVETSKTLEDYIETIEKCLAVY